MGSAKDWPSQLLDHCKRLAHIWALKKMALLIIRSLQNRFKQTIFDIQKVEKSINFLINLYIIAVFMLSSDHKQTSVSYKKV